MRIIIEERQLFQLTSVKGFIGPLPRPIGLLGENFREGRRALALLSPFLDPLYGRDIVPPFPMPHHLQQYPIRHVGTLSALGNWLFVRFVFIVRQMSCGAASVLGGF